MVVVFLTSNGDRYNKHKQTLLSNITNINISFDLVEATQKISWTYHYYFFFSRWTESYDY